jgi:Cu-Zn family superoxide dismutase
MLPSADGACQSAAPAKPAKDTDEAPDVHPADPATRIPCAADGRSGHHRADAKGHREGPGADIGTITILAEKDGTGFRLNLRGLPPGPHEFGAHENNECGPILLDSARIPAGAAGDFWDPDHTGRHDGPTGTGQRGDLPAIGVGPNGSASQTLLAPRITGMNSLHGRSLVIQAGGDSYRDIPLRGGGGGGNIACSVIR